MRDKEVQLRDWEPAEGETFEYKGKMYKAIKAEDDSCTGCAFNGMDCFGTPVCGVIRKDRQTIVYKLVCELE